MFKLFKNIIINIICHYANKQGEHFLIPYEPIRVFFFDSLPQNKWLYMKNQYYSNPTTVRLRRNYTDSSVYKIEIALKEEKTTEYLPFAIEQYAAKPTYKNLTSEIFTVNCSEGKIIIIVDYKNFTRDLLLSTLHCILSIRDTAVNKIDMVLLP